MASRTMRPRPIDMSNRMPVVQSQNELWVDPEDQQLKHRRDIAEGSFVDEDDGETFRILTETYEKDDNRKANIPVPPIVIIEDYDKFVPKNFVKPSSYIRFTLPTDKELDELVEYEMDEPDMVFITQTLPGLKIQIAEDKFEKIVDRLEKESYKLGKMCDQIVLEQYKLGGKHGAAVYEHWRKKREKLGKPLIRRFQPPTSIQDTSPHSTFRPREKEEKRIRRTRKNDKDAHKKLKNLQADFRRAKELLECVVRREKMKKVLLELDFCLQFAKDIKDIPDNILHQHNAFFQELQASKQRQNKQSQDGQENLGAGASRPRPAARPAAVAGVEDEFIKQEEQAPEKMEGIKRCFQHLMLKWDEDGDDAGTSVLPISKDAKLIQFGSADAGETLKFRGRARVGRGGRVVFDRCSVRVANLHAASAGGKVGGSWSRDGGAGSEVSSILEDMKRSSMAASRGGALRAPSSAWDWGKLHSRVNVKAGADAGKADAPPAAAAAAAAVKKVADVKKTSLGQMSAMWGTTGVGQKRRLQVMPGTSLGNAGQKKAKVEGEDAAASTASTANGAQE